MGGERCASGGRYLRFYGPPNLYLTLYDRTNPLTTTMSRSSSPTCALIDARSTSDNTSKTWNHPYSTSDRTRTGTGAVAASVAYCATNDDNSMCTVSARFREKIFLLDAADIAVIMAT